MPFIVGSTGSVLPAPNTLVVDEYEDGIAGAKAVIDDTTVKAKIEDDRIFIVTFGFLFSMHLTRA